MLSCRSGEARVDKKDKAMAEVEEIVGWMALGSECRDIQLVQTRFKRRLAETWRIPAGARILEIGCGQGDMTAILADLVGPDGHVTAVDLADPTYGAPISLGASARHLLKSPIGRRIDFRFNVDVLDPSVTFEEAAFDYVVLAHSSWYFGSTDQLRAVLQHVRRWSKRLCFSEWSLSPHTLDQVAHLLAVLIQGQLEAFKQASESNIRTPLSASVLKNLLQESGWTPISESLLEAPELQDAGWEIDHCLRTCRSELLDLPLPARLVPLLESQLDVLAQLAAQRPAQALASYTVLAER